MFSRSRILPTQRSLLLSRTPYNSTKPRTSRSPSARTPSSHFIHSKRPFRYVYSRSQKGESLYTTIKRAERKTKLRARQAAKEKQDNFIENLAGLVVGGFILAWICVRLREGTQKEVEDYDYEQVCGYAWRGGIV